MGLAGSAGSLAPRCCVWPHKTSGVLGAGFMGVDDASPTERPWLLLPKGFPPAFLLSGCGFLGLQGPGSQALPAGFAFWVVSCYFFFLWVLQHRAAGHDREILQGMRGPSSVGTEHQEPLSTSPSFHQLQNKTPRWDFGAGPGGRGAFLLSDSQGGRSDPLSSDLICLCVFGQKLPLFWGKGIFSSDFFCFGMFFSLDTNQCQRRATQEEKSLWKEL